jgi:hypothetical protein
MDSPSKTTGHEPDTTSAAGIRKSLQQSFANTGVMIAALAQAISYHYTRADKDTIEEHIIKFDRLPQTLERFEENRSITNSQRNIRIPLPRPMLQRPPIGGHSSTQSTAN